MLRLISNVYSHYRVKCKAGDQRRPPHHFLMYCQITNDQRSEKTG